MIRHKTRIVKYGSKYSRAIAIPKKIATDSSFPFKDTDDLYILICKDGSITIRKSKS